MKILFLIMMKLTFKLSIFAISTVFVSLFFNACSQDCGISLRVCSFNLRGVMDGDKGVRHWSHRKDIVARFIKQNDIDIIGTQESAIKQFPALNELLPEYAYLGESSLGKEDGRVINLVMYKKSRFKLIKGETLWLSSTPEKMSKILDSAEPRTLTYAHLIDNKTGKDFFAFSTHFDHIGEMARRQQAKILMDLVAKIAGKKPFVIVGDFNARENSETINYLKSRAEIIDARVLSKAKPIDMPHTYHAFKGFPKKAENKFVRIDYIWVSKPSQALNYEVSNYNENGVYPSDHFPIVSDILLK